jgi:hypothetical protein
MNSVKQLMFPIHDGAPAGAEVSALARVSLARNPSSEFLAGQASVDRPDEDRWLAAHPEFPPKAHQMARLDRAERRTMLAFGAVAERVLKRYDRDLNAGKLAGLLSHLSGRPIARGTINDRRAAFRMYRAYKRASGGSHPDVEPSKLAVIWQAGRRSFTVADKVELCRRASERHLSKSEIRTEALRLSRYKSAAALSHTVRATVRRVEQMDGLGLLRDCPAETASLIVMDWMYKPYAGGPTLPVPNAYIPEDPAGHLVACIDAASRALAPLGAIALFVDHRSDPDPRITAALKERGFRRVDQYVLRQSRAGFSSSRGALFASMHETIDFYRRADVELPIEHLRYEPSISPKWRTQSRQPVSEATVHPFEKPVELFECFIGAVTVRGLVVDPFAGTGNSGVAAVRLGCGYLGAEMVPEYVELANQRIALATERETETVEAINFALAGTNEEQRAAILFELERAGLRIDRREVAA